jgi:hypothetical protein
MLPESVSLFIMDPVPVMTESSEEVGYMSFIMADEDEYESVVLL